MTTAGAGGPVATRAVVREDHVAELGARAGGPAVHLPVEDQPAADAGSERQHHEVIRAAAGAEAPFGLRRGVRVVVDRYGQAEPVAHSPAQVELAERDVDRGDGDARALVDRGRDAEAERS